MSGPHVSLTDFVGAEACAECHAIQYEAWTSSTHGRAGGAPGDVRLLAAFDARPIRFRDATVVPRVTADSGYVFSVAQGGTPPRVMRVVGVIGGGHMVGGGTQGFLAEHMDGTLRFLPFDYSAVGEWFCNTAGRAGRGWVPITGDLALADCFDWPPSRVFGSLDRFANCQQCHGSQVTVRFDTSARRYETRYTTLAINCESCHGPGRQHVERMAGGAAAQTDDIAMGALATLGKDESVEVCLPCHALKQELATGYLPGSPFRDHYSVGLPAFGDAPLFPDGRTRTFAYQEGHLASACYRNGSMTCTDCHDPHTQGYRDHTGRPLPDRFHDGQCVSCHPSKAGADLAAHTRHAPQSAGSRCVSCHMPYLQQPTVGTAIRYARSDHTIPVPRPAFDEGLGIVSACRGCHADQPASALEGQRRNWYGEGPPHAREVRGLLDALPLRDAERAAGLVLGQSGGHYVAQFTGLAHYFIRYLEPDMPSLAPSVVDRLAEAGESPDDDVAALALASLHFARGDDRDVRERLATRLHALGERERPVRARWAQALLRRGAAYRAAGDPPRAARTFGKVLELAPDHVAAHAELGAALSDAGRYDSALVHFRQSLALDPVQPLVLVNVAFARMQLGDLQGGLLTYQEAASLSPADAIVYLSWGNALFRMRRFGEAAAAFERARELEPGLAPAHFGLGAAHAQLGRREEAVAAIRRGLEFAPSDEGALALLAQLGG